MVAQRHVEMSDLDEDFVVEHGRLLRARQRRRLPLVAEEVDARA
jgi:hypothetical protein